MRETPGNPLILGSTPDGKPIPMTPEQRGRHLYVVGASGTGKTKFLESLIRQDILAWAKSRCGMVVIDPHGELVDSLMGWLACQGLTHLPIVPIDLRRGDWVVAYNLLRPRPIADPAVVVGHLAAAIAHAWGQGDMNATPRLAKWLRTLLATVYDHGGTLADALALLSNAELRRAMIASLRDRFASAVWASTAGLRAGEFLEQVESTLNRLTKFLANRSLQAMLCQGGPSFDFSLALEQGSIVLVSLATAKAQVDSEDAKTLGSVLLSDLWTAAQIRGKGDEAGSARRPCYVYVDEFQNYMNPTIAEALDQARGFGLHFTLAHQFPMQLRDRGDLGRMIYNSVLANARSKVVFQLEHPADLPELALWLGRGQIDLKAVKHQHYATKVLGHQLQYLPSYSTSTSEMYGEGSSQTEGEAVSHSEGSGISETEATSYSTGGARARSAGHAVTSGTSEAEGESAGLSWQESAGLLGPSGAPPLSGLSSVSSGNSSSLSTTRAEADSNATADIEAWSETHSSAVTRSQSSADAVSRSRANSTSRSRASGVSQGTSHAPVLIPVMGQEASPPQFWSLDEQTFLLTQGIAALPKRHALLRLADQRLPVELQSRMLAPSPITLRGREAAERLYLKRLPFALTMPEALRRLAEQEQQLVRRLCETERLLEPAVYARPVEAHLLPAPAEPVDNRKPKKKRA